MISYNYIYTWFFLGCLGTAACWGKQRYIFHLWLVLFYSSETMESASPWWLQQKTRGTCTWRGLRVFVLVVLKSKRMGYDKVLFWISDFFSHHMRLGHRPSYPATFVWYWTIQCFEVIQKLNRCWSSIQCLTGRYSEMWNANGKESFILISL